MQVTVQIIKNAKLQTLCNLIINKEGKIPFVRLFTVALQTHKHEHTKGILPAPCKSFT